MARASSKAKVEGSFAGFSRFNTVGLTCLLKMSRYETAFDVRCTKCKGFVGELVYGANTNTQALLRVCSFSVVHCPNAAPLGIPPDGVFDDDDDVRDAKTPTDGM